MRKAILWKSITYTLAGRELIAAQPEIHGVLYGVMSFQHGVVACKTDEPDEVYGQINQLHLDSLYALDELRSSCDPLGSHSAIRKPN